MELTEIMILSVMVFAAANVLIKYHINNYKKQGRTLYFITLVITFVIGCGVSWYVYKIPFPQFLFLGMLSAVVGGSGMELVEIFKNRGGNYDDKKDNEEK